MISEITEKQHWPTDHPKQCPVYQISPQSDNYFKQEQNSNEFRPPSLPPPRPQQPPIPKSLKKLEYHSEFFLEEEYMISTTTLTMRTVSRQKVISFLFVSCWYSFAWTSYCLPSWRLFLTRVMVMAAICSFMPCCRIILPVSRAILWILVTSRSIWSISSCSCSRIFLLISFLLLAKICPESCCSLIWLISTAFSVLTCLALQFFMNQSFFCNSAGLCVSMNSLFICLMRSSRPDCSSISTSDFCSQLQQRFSFSYSASCWASLEMLFQAIISVVRRRSFSIEALIDPPNFQSLRYFQPMLMALLSSIQVGLFLRYCSQLNIQYLYTVTRNLSIPTTTYHPDKNAHLKRQQQEHFFLSAFATCSDIFQSQSILFNPS